MRLLPRTLCVFVLAIAGCYSYSAARPGVAYESRLVRLSLTDSGSVMLGSQIGQSVLAIEGNFVADSAGSYIVSVQNTERRDGSIVDWKGERVVVPIVLVSSIGARQFSATRTALFGALATAAIVGATAAFGGLGAVFGSGHSGGGGTPSSR